jgi:hypothetical protein
MRRYVWHEETSGRRRSGASAERRIPLGLAQLTARCRDPATGTLFMGSQFPTIRLCFGFREAISNPTAKSTKIAKRAETEPQGLRADQGCCRLPSGIFRWSWRASASLLRPESLSFFLFVFSAFFAVRFRVLQLALGFRISGSAGLWFSSARLRLRPVQGGSRWIKRNSHATACRAPEGGRLGHRKVHPSPPPNPLPRRGEAPKSQTSTPFLGGLRVHLVNAVLPNEPKSASAGWPLASRSNPCREEAQKIQKQQLMSQPPSPFASHSALLSGPLEDTTFAKRTQLAMILPPTILPFTFPRQLAATRLVRAQVSQSARPPFAWFACFAVRTHPLLNAILPNEPIFPTSSAATCRFANRDGRPTCNLQLSTWNHSCDRHFAKRTQTISQHSYSQSLTFHRVRVVGVASACRQPHWHRHGRLIPVPPQPRPHCQRKVGFGSFRARPDGLPWHRNQGVRAPR